MEENTETLVERDEFRGTMRKYPSGVGIITTGSNADRRGLTATAICSFSDSPPSIIVCVNQNASAHDFIKNNKVFAVNILANEHRELAQCFSGQTGLRGEERFQKGEWISLRTGSPILSNSLAAIDCELILEKTVFTHTIFIGKVVALLNNNYRPLVYHENSYKALSALRENV